jgi:hypothetical protein
MVELKRRLAVLLVLTGALVAGCPPRSTGPAPPKEAPPPHGGKLFAPKGNEHPVHAELKFDGVAKPVIYLLDEAVEKAVSTPAEKVTVSIEGTPRKVILFKPDREDKDPKGESSRFVAEEAWPDGVDLKKVEITLMYDGKQWTLVLDEH